MSESKEWEKLNLPATSTYIEFPLAFTGKSKKPGTSVFSGLLLSQQFILAIIHTMNKAVGEPAKLTYDFFVIKYGMSKETLNNAFTELINRGIIKRVSRSRYKIDKPYKRKPYVEIDDCLFKTDRRLAYSRKLVIGFLRGAAKNEETGGKFISSHARIGKAINLPRTTAGDAIREITSQGYIKTEKYSGDDMRLRNCSEYLVNPEVLAVQHPQKMNSLEISDSNSDRQRRADAMHERLLSDPQYGKLIEQINNNYINKIQAMFRSGGNESAELKQLETESEELRIELEDYFKLHKIRRGVFPPGFFKTDKEEIGA